MIGNTPDAREPVVNTRIESPTKSFMELSIEVAKRFIHTVVFVDDKALLPELEPPPTVVNEPRRKSVDTSSSQTTSVRKSNAHDLDVKKLTDIFASKGMVCSILKPISEEDPLGKSINAAKRADILVLDWVINKVKGKKAIEIIKTIISNDNINGLQRLRLIIIYSGENELDDIIRDLKSELGNEFKNTNEDFTFTKGHIRISIFIKPGVENLPEQYANRIVQIENLPDALAGEYASLTAGILSNVTNGIYVSIKG